MVEVMRKKGDADGADVWLRIIVAIGALAEPPGGATLGLRVPLQGRKPRSMAEIAEVPQAEIVRPPFEARVSRRRRRRPLFQFSRPSPRACVRSSIAVMIRFQTTRPFRSQARLPSDYRCAPKEPEIGVPCRPSVPEKVPAVSGAPFP